MAGLPEDEVSIVKVSSRSVISRSNDVEPSSLQTVAANVGAPNLFQKKGFKRLVGRVIFIPFHAEGGPEGGGGGGGGRGPSRGGGGGGGGGGSMVDMDVEGGAGGDGGGGGGGGGDDEEILCKL